MVGLVIAMAGAIVGTGLVVEPLMLWVFKACVNQARADDEKERERRRI